MTTATIPTNYPQFVIEATRECPECGYETDWHATPDCRPTPARCPNCACRLWATLNVDGDGSIELVVA